MFEVSLKEIAKFFIPKIQIEFVKDEAGEVRKVRQQKKIEESKKEEEQKPEIMIRKSLINTQNTKRNIDDIYEDEETEKSAKSKQIKITDIKAKEVEKTLTENEKAAETSEDIVWEFPSLDLLKTGDSNVTVDDDVLMKNAETIKKKLSQFGIDVNMHEVNVGPTVIQYTLKPNEGVKLSKITGLKNDLALALAAERVRIEAPIPGKSLVGIEVPNSYRATVYLKELLESSVFTDAKSKLTLPLGRDVSGKPIIASLETMPHLLIAGATGSGKSVAMNVFLTSLLYQMHQMNLK